MTYRSAIKSIFEPLVVLAAVIYFVVDAVAVYIFRPVARDVVNLKLFRFIGSWIASRGRYTILVLFLVPLILLEPVKPISAYLIATGHFVSGAVLLAIGEAMKIIIVERIFHIGRDKLLTIAAFAWTYWFIVGWLKWLRASAPWRAVRRRSHQFVNWAARLNHGGRHPVSPWQLRSVRSSSRRRHY